MGVRRCEKLWKGVLGAWWADKDVGKGVGGERILVVMLAVDKGGVLVGRGGKGTFGMGWDGIPIGGCRMRGGVV
jgi:hypothetical protein